MSFILVAHLPRLVFWEQRTAAANRQTLRKFIYGFIYTYICVCIYILIYAYLTKKFLQIMCTVDVSIFFHLLCDCLEQRFSTFLPLRKEPLRKKDYIPCLSKVIVVVFPVVNIIYIYIEIYI